MTVRARRSRLPWRLLSLVVLAACSAAPPMPDPSADHPASPQAESAPVPAPAGLLPLQEVPRQLPRGPSAPGAAANGPHGGRK